jgi:hypothetical protein
MDLFELNGRVVVNLADALKAFDEIQKSGQKTESKLSKFFSGVGKGALVVGKAVGTGLMAGGAAMGALTVKALNLSGELEQNMGGSEAVFKNYAGKMQETAKEAFKNMGLSTSDFLGTANKMGALFQGAGFDIQESADLSSKAMQRAADVASIMGIDTSSAMEAIAGAAKGNFTMMDNLGVAMNDTTLNAYALEKGMNKTTQEMTNQEKIGLAMEMFMEKTAYAAGNYAKENETLAGSLGTAKAALTNFLDGSGSVDQLVGAFSSAADVIIKNVTEIAPRLIQGVTDIANKVIPMIPPLLEKLLPVIIQGATSLIDGLVTALPQLVSMLVDTALPMVLEGFVTIVNSLIEALPQLVEMIASALPTLIPTLIDGLVSMIVTLCTNFSQIIQPLIDNLPDTIISIVDAICQNLPILIDGLITLVMGIVEAIPQIVQALVDATPKVVELLVTALLKCIPQLILGFVELIMGVAKATNQIFASLKQAFPNAMKGVWEAIKNVFSNVGSFFSEKFTDAKEKVISAFSNIKEKLAEPFTKARDKIKEVADKIKGFFKGEISMPKIKLPKFSISPSGWKIGDLLKGSIPKLSIKWNAKGAIMKEPTLFGYNPVTGTIQGGGEAGDEAVAPIDTLQQYVKAAVQSENTVMASKLDRIIELLVRFFPEMIEAMNIDMYLDTGVLVAETASQYDVALGRMAIKKGRGR